MLSDMFLLMDLCNQVFNHSLTNMILIFFSVLLTLCSATPFWFSVSRFCNPTCKTSHIFCPQEGLVVANKFEICLPVLPTKYEDTGRWFSFYNKSSISGLKIRVLASCFANRHLSSCVGLENKCRNGVLHKQHSGVLEQTLCVYFFNSGEFEPGFRYFYKDGVYTGSKQFGAKEKHTYNNMAQLEPGQGQTAEDDYNYDEEWFLWLTPKPGSGYERLS